MTIFLWIMDLLIPIIMIIIGAYFGKKPPKAINDFAGYRTSRSKLSKKTWDYANKRCGLLYFKIGLMLLILVVIANSIVVIVFGKALTLDTKGIFTMIYALVGMVGCIIPLPIVESELRKKFDNKGNEKNI